MIDIISKSDGPRKEDVQAQKLIKENQHVIRGLADGLTQGQYSASRAAQNTSPAPEFKSSTHLVNIPESTAKPPKPYLRISMNGRVVIVDQETNQQLHYVGEIRNQQGGEVFLLASKKNGFFSQADEELLAHLDEFDQSKLSSDYTEEMLKRDLGKKLGFEE